MKTTGSHESDAYSGVSFEYALHLALHEPEDALLSAATALREAAFGSRVELCAIINTRSGNCSMDCRFCSQSRHNATDVEVFDLLSEADIRERLAALVDVPLRHIGLVTSGAALGRHEVAALARTIERLPAHWQGRVCGSLGRLDAASLSTLRRAGLVRFHHNLETAEAYYPSVCTTQRWDERLSTVHQARAADLSVCSGGLFGMGETWEHRVDFALRLRAEGIVEIPLNFLHAHPGTPLASIPPLSAVEALRIVAVFRHILPHATLRVCGGRPGTLKERQADLFAAGANALMTGNYLTTAGSGFETDLAMISRLGLKVDA